MIRVTAQRKRDIRFGAAGTLLIVCAVAARAVTRGNRDADFFLPVSLLRSCIYIGLMTWWGVSLRQRIIQTQVRRYLEATAALCVLVALSLEKPENYRLPKWTSLLYIPAVLLLLLVLTNDLHQLVFVFPADAAAWLDTDHGYGVGHFIVMGWIALGMVTAIVTMLSQIPRSA